MILLLMSCGLIGCVNRYETNTEPLFCDIASPIYINEKDTFTPETAKQILSHNITGFKLCDWKKGT